MRHKWATKGYLLVLACLGAGGCTPRQPVTMRVMTYNIHHGHGMDGKFDLSRTVLVLNAAKPDLLALQEVDSKCERSQRVDEPQELAAQTGMQVAFGKTIDWQGGDYGIAILSRYPILRQKSYPLLNIPPHEPRVLLEIGVSVAGRELTFYDLDLDDNPDNAERFGSVDLFKQTVEQQNGLVILGGDLFGTPDHPAISRLLGFMTDACAGRDEQNTCSAKDPKKRIDYVMYRSNPHLRCISCEVIPEPLAAQHRPVLAVFEVR